MTTDLFDEPTTTFLTLEHLVGRAVAILVHSKSEQPSRNPTAAKKTYTRCVADVFVLDGEVTELVPEVPFLVRDMFISGAGMTPRIASKAGTGKWTAGRIDEKPSSVNARIMVHGIQPFDEKDPGRDLANAAIGGYVPLETEDLFE